MGVVLWNDLVIALADYRRRGSANSKTFNFADASAATSADTVSRAPRRRGLNSPAAAAAGCTLDWSGVDIGASLGRSDSAGSPWPKLAVVAEAVGKRVGWLPRMRLAEPALLE